MDLVPAHAVAWSWLGPLLLLAPFVAWDVARYLLRRRGDRSPSRRATLLRHFTNEDLEIGRAHLRRLNRVALPSHLLSYLLYAALLFGGLSDRLERWLQTRLGGSLLLSLAAYLGILLAARTLLALPLEIWVERIERREGLSTTTARTFVADRVRGLLVGLLLSYVISAPLLMLTQARPRSWALPAAAVVIAFSAGLLWLKPWLLDPLFNHFRPLDDPELRAALSRLGQSDGAPLERVLIMDASRRSRALNAYVTGMGSSRRVVLYDTLVAECPPAEVASVVAHELGHWRGHHLLLGFLGGALASTLGLLIFGELWASVPVRSFFGLSSSSRLGLLVLLPFLGGLAGTLLAPLGAALSRRLERAADAAALLLTGDPRAFIELEKRLVRKARADLLQHRLLHLFHGSHPLPEERIAVAEARLG